MARIDYDRAAQTYDGGRAGPAATRAAWHPLLETVAGRARRWVDVGAGTGIWSAQLAAWFSCDVVGVEPSAGMRKRALDGRRRRGVTYAAGRAEALPLASGSCDAAWLSTVIHHLELDEAAGEVVRVLRPGAPICIRSSFPDRRYDFGIERFFPEVRRVWDTFPTVERTRAAFERAGAAFDDLRRVPEPAAGTLADVHDRLPTMRHADTLLSGLTDDEFARGLARVDEAVAREETVPSDGLDLLLFRVSSRPRRA